MANSAVDPRTLSAMTRWRIVVLLMGTAAIGHFNRVGISVAGTEIFIDKFGIEPTRMGWVYSAFLILYTLSMIPGGWLIDRLGAARMLTLFSLSMGTFVIFTGMLGWMTGSPERLWLGLLFIRGLAGMCNAPLHPGAAHVVSDLMPNRSRATANGMVTAGALIGVALCYPVTGWLMDRVGWQWAFVISGGTMVAYGLYWRSYATPLLPGPGLQAVHATEHTDWRAVWSLAKQGNLWLLGMSYWAFGYFQYLFFYWTTYYFEDVLHIPAVESRQASLYINLAQAAGMALGGMSTDYICKVLGIIRGRRAIVVTGMGISSAFGLLGLNVTGYLNVSICLAISMAALGICEGVFWTTATDIGGKSRGFSGAFMNALGNVGGFISPVLTPYLVTKMGWPAAITIACVISGLGGAVWFVIKPPGDRLTFSSDVPEPAATTVGV